MGIKFEGLKSLEKELNDKYGKENMQRIIDKALVAGGNRILHIIKQEQAKHRDTGATVREATLSEPLESGGGRIVKIHWKGPENRYALIHLQEQGFYNRDGTFNNPSSKGLLQRAIASGREIYFQTVSQEMEKRL